MMMVLFLSVLLFRYFVFRKSVYKHMLTKKHVNSAGNVAAGLMVKNSPTLSITFNLNFIQSSIQFLSSHITFFNFFICFLLVSHLTSSSNLYLFPHCFIYIHLSLSFSLSLPVSLSLSLSHLLFSLSLFLLLSLSFPLFPSLSPSPSPCFSYSLSLSLSLIYFSLFSIFPSSAFPFFRLCHDNRCAFT